MMMEHFITLGNYQFHYWVQGRSPNPPILFFHGFMGNGDEFREVMSCLSDRFYCIAVDLPGHGKTQVVDPADYAFNTISMALIQFMDTLMLAPCRLVGYSMGGRLALYLALHYPAYVRTVVLESASPGLRTAAERRRRVERDRQLAQELETNFPAFLQKWYDQPLFAQTQAHPDFKKLLNHRLQNSPSNLAYSLRYAGTGCQPSLWEQLAQNTVPMLLLAGEQDPKFVQINTQMAGLCPLMTLKVVSNCGHNIHFEQMNSFVALIRDDIVRQGKNHA